MESVLQDLRFTVRQLLKNKSFTLTAILSLALGIGATTAVFSVVYGVLLDPYPYKDAKRMVHVELFDKDGRQMGLMFNTGPELNELKQAKCVDDIFMQGGNTVTMTGSNQIPVSVQLGEYTPNLFEYMGVPPLLGRQFTSADMTDGKASPVAVLSYLFWKKQFNASRDVLGKIDRTRPQAVHHHRRGRSALYLGRLRRVRSVHSDRRPARLPQQLHQAQARRYPGSRQRRTAAAGSAVSATATPRIMRRLSAPRP